MEDSASIYKDISKFLAPQKPKRGAGTPKTVTSPDYKQRESDARRAAREADAHLLGLKQYYSLRGSWSTFLKWLLAISIATQVVILIVVGTVWIYAPDRMPTAVAERILFLVIGENFLQIVGMCWLVVQFLFPKGKTATETYPQINQ